MSLPRRPRVRWHLWLVRALRPFVPRTLRQDWVREWEAELDSRETELRRWGVLPRRASWRVFGDSTGAVWDALWLQAHRWEDEMIQDIRFGLRLVLRSPWLSSTAIVSLAIGIGATTAVFTVINAALLKALPYPAVERLIAVTQGDTRYFSLSEYRDLQAGVTMIEHLAAIETRDFVLAGDGPPEQIRGQRVSASFPTLVGLDSALAPVVGRSFASRDFEPDHPAVVLISHQLWARRFASDPAVVGRAITLDTASATIVGVLPAAFDLFPNSEVLEPLVPASGAQNDRLYHYLEVLGRLPVETTPARAEAALTVIMSRVPDRQPIRIAFVRELLVKNVRRVLLTMWVMTGLVLAVACLNFANLLTARATARQQELAVRASLGGRRLRLARQLIVEALVLVAIGGAIGLFLAHFGATLLVAAMPQQFPGAAGVSVDGRVLGFALLVSALSGVLFAVLPALGVSAAAERAGTLLSLGSLRSSASTTRRTHTALASVQVALTLALLVGAALFIKSFWQLARIEPGYQARGAVTLRYDLPVSDYPDSASAARLTDALGQGLRALPAVRAVGETSNLPLGPIGMEFRAFAVENGPADVGPAELAPPGLPPPPPPPLPPGGAAVSVLRFFQAVHVKVGPGFFDAMGIPLVAGRDFTTRDRESTLPVTIVNRAFADRYFPGADPIGRRVRLSPVTPWMTVVGVVGNIRRFARDDAYRSEFYRPFAQAGAVRASDGSGNGRAVTSVMFVVRTPRAADDLARSARGSLATLDPALPVAQVGTLQGAIDDTVAQQRLLLRLFLIFAVATLIVAAVGVYGVTTYVVNRRQHEMAVRVALGARPSSIEALVVGQALPVIGIGLALGLATAVALSRSVGEYLFGVSPLDAWAYAAMAATLALVVTVASYLPARRAGRTDPLIALKGL
jgi:putative ABC transport system permease protein